MKRNRSQSGKLIEALESRTFLTTVPTNFADTLVAGGLSTPTSMTFAPDGRLFVTQKTGAIRIVKNGALLAGSFASLTVDSAGERGLLGLDFDPDFTNNGFIYVYHTVPGATSHNRVSRFKAADADPGPSYVPGDVSDGTAPVDLLDVDDLSSATNHNGGAIHFGPDGKLYVAVGENANRANSQVLTNRLGKILRINSDGSIPTDNPFYTTASGANRSIWAMGLRNPYTFTFQPGTGRMFINDVGENIWEEINEGGSGRNYGWGTTEGTFDQAAFPNFTEPLYTYHHGSDTFEGNVITGGAFYNPAVQNFPSSYLGKYFFADNNQNWIHVMDPANGNTIDTFATGASAPVDLDTGPDGALYYLNIGNGQIRKITSTVSSVVTRNIVYNNSSFDGNNAGASPLDDAAIDSTRTALLPGVRASAANVSGYDKGINGMIVDVAALPAGSGPTSADFVVETSTDGATWSLAASPAVTTRRGAGLRQTDRLTLIWPDNSIRNKWVRVTMNPGTRTGLAAADVWYFGSEVGNTDSEATSTTTNISVDADDFYGVRDHLRSYDNLAPVTWSWDLNHDGVTDVTDMMIVRANATSGSTALPLFTATSPVVAGKSVRSATTVSGSATPRVSLLKSRIGPAARGWS